VPTQSPGPPFSADAGRAAGARIILVRHAATSSSQSGLLLGREDEPLGSLGGVQAGKAAELLLDLQASPRRQPPGASPGPLLARGGATAVQAGTSVARRLRSG
jgi:hypothetical protein